MLASNRPEDEEGGTIIDDDNISTCDEENLPYHQRMTTVQAAILRAENRKYKRCTVFLLFVTFLIGVIVACVRYYSSPRLVSNENGEKTLEWDWDNTEDNGNTEKVNEERFQQTLEYLKARAVSDPATLDLASNTNVWGVSRPQYTPQYQAALWIAKLDKRRLSIPSTTETSREEYPFLQRYALAVFYFSTDGQNWHMDDHFMNGLHECNWFKVLVIGSTQLLWGVYCDGNVNYSQDDPWKGDRTVTQLYLPRLSNNMFGTIPAELRHLRQLKALRIENNNGISGRIPFQLEALNELEELHLASVSLSGTIPHQFGNLKKLKILDLERNNLSGDTTKGDLDFLEKMESLTTLVLDYNSKITGTFPNSVTKLSKLRGLSLSNTNMYGELPASVADMTDLMFLYLDDCDFEGSTYAIQKLPNLTAVYLEDNQFNDTIDNTFFSNQKKLVHLDISNCSFSGSIPTHLFNYPDLTVLDMSVNKLDGEFPAEAIPGDLNQTNLQFLSMHTNGISGPIPTSIGQLKNLTTLDLSSNEFSGEMPNEIGNLTDLSILFLGRNNFTESPVPIWLRNMTQLTELSLKSASLKGHIPIWLGELSRMSFLDLGENDLFSTIPQSLNNLTKLKVLILNDNRLWGELGLGNLVNLDVLLVDGNSLTGNTDEMCQHTLMHFVADCGRDPGDFDMPIDIELDCECCTQCCWDENTTCNDSEWLGNHKGIWEYGYSRVSWDFEDGEVPLI